MVKCFRLIASHTAYIYPFELKCRHYHDAWLLWASYIRCAAENDYPYEHEAGMQTSAATIWLSYILWHINNRECLPALSNHTKLEADKRQRELFTDVRTKVGWVSCDIYFYRLSLFLRAHKANGFPFQQLSQGFTGYNVVLYRLACAIYVMKLLRARSQLHAEKNCALRHKGLFFWFL